MRHEPKRAEKMSHSSTSIQSLMQWFRKPLNAVIVLGSLTIGGVAINIAFHRSEISSVLDEKEVEARKILALLKSHDGKVVLNETNAVDAPNKTIIGLQMEHGGSTSIDVFRREPKLFGQWLQHQDGLYAALVDLMKEDKYKFLIEGFTGNLTGQFSQDELELDAFMEQSPEASAFVRNEAKKAVLQGGMNDALGALEALRATKRFEMYCVRKGYDQRVVGINPPDHPVLSQVFQDKIFALASQQVVSNSDIEEFIASFQKFQKEDFIFRHRYIRDQLETGVNIVLLGSSHFESGNDGEESRPPYSFEEEMRQEPSTRLIVWGEGHARGLQVPNTSSNIIVLGMNPTVDEIRGYISFVRKKMNKD